MARDLPPICGLSLSTMSIPVTRMQPGQNLDLGSGASLQVLSIDARGAVLLLEWDNFRFLLPLGMDFKALETFPRFGYAQCFRLLLAELGYAPLNPPEFISFLHPQVALLSVALRIKPGYRPRRRLEALEGYNLLRTDLNGWIELTTDGKSDVGGGGEEIRAKCWVLPKRVQPNLRPV